ncbi:MAG: hypothetical protein AAF386_08745 [Pseudomonadota bacterium]
MTGQTKTLIAIAAFVAFCFGSFIWYIATQIGAQDANASPDLIMNLEVV